MFCKGEYRNDKKAYGVICSHTKRTFEAMLINNGVVESAYKKDETGEYAFGNVVAKEMATTLLLGIRGCTSKNGNAMAFELGVLTQHEFIKTRVDYLIQLSAGELCGCDISGENQRIELLYDKNIAFPSGVEYIKLTTSSKKDISVADGDDVIVRSVNEIALEKDDITWLKNKKYYIVNDDEKAEQIFSYLDNYDGVIAYDTETTGLRINCFGKINSSYQRELEQYNKEHPNEQLRADKLVGIIYCVEPNVSYYFPCGNRKFKNLYDDKESPVRKRLIEQIKAKYTVGELRDSDGDMADYVRKTAPEDFTPDVILMERNRHILTTKHIVPHGGSFEWKVGWLYEIDTNIKDDTMLLHQIMYKFRSTTRNSGEPSNLKYLAKVELGIDQWELNDFFPDFKEDDGGEIRVKAGSRKKKQNSKIDFSYMDYEGTKVYAPTDGDVTLQLLLRYKKDMIENHPEQVYIYNVEVLVECAIGYMEFYGHRINEDKILGVRDRTKAKIVKIESQIRQLANYSSDKELEKYNELIDIISKSEKDPDNKELLQQTLTISNELKAIMDNDETHPLNLASPAQVADLFYVKMGIPFKSGEKMSVAKGQLKGLLKEKNEDGSPKYPIVHLYSDYKKEDTLVTKFFDNLPYFMYPGGLIFSHYGQISTATGRMSCIEENTLISVVGGDKKIKDIKVGDLVYCYDNDGNLRARKVTKVIDNGYKECIKLNWRSQGTHKEGELICTPDHRILTKDAGWVQAQDLQCGDRVYHLRKSKEDRPRLFGANGICEQEQLFIKREVFGCTDYNVVIHHKNEKTPDNDLSNLEIKSRAEHSSEHSKKLVASGRIDHKIISQENVGIKHVYDLEVEELHNFIAGEVCVHNCNKPNAQQYPKTVTSIVEPRDGYVMMDADYSQIEYRVLVALSNNTKLAELFSDPDSDYHTLMASQMYNVPYASVTPKMRSDSKSFNFGIPYGMGLGSLAILLTGVNNQRTRDEAAEKYELYFKDQPMTRKFFDQVKEMAQVKRYTKTFWNRYRYYSFTDADGNENNAKKAAALRQAGNAVIQGTAADIFKISVARNFMYIRENNLLGDLLIVNMVHDEQLMEVNVKKLNMQRILRDVGINMQFKINGFPPLYIGAGIGPAWGKAKGKMAEIHPNLLEQLSREADVIPLRHSKNEVAEPKDVLKYFEERVLGFRRQKVIDYITNPDNFHQTIHPAIGGLINLQFNYGRGGEAKAYMGGKYTDEEFLLLNLGDFIAENNLDVKAEWFKAMEAAVDEEEDEEYDEREDGELEEIEDEKSFSLVDESNKFYGSSLQDIISIFGTCVLDGMNVCGIDMRNIYYKKKDAIIDYIATKVCDESDSNALEVVYLLDGNVLNHTGVYVSGLNASKLEGIFKANNNTLA